CDCVVGPMKSKTSVDSMDVGLIYNILVCQGEQYCLNARSGSLWLRSGEVETQTPDIPGDIDLHKILNPYEGELEWNHTHNRLLVELLNHIKYVLNELNILVSLLFCIDAVRNPGQQGWEDEVGVGMSSSD